MPMLAEIAVATLLLASGLVVLGAALGLLRLPDFFLRMHAPALASTLAAWLVTAASIVHVSAREGSAALHVWLVIIVLSITAPVTTIVLARAALFRERLAGGASPPPLRPAGDVDRLDRADRVCAADTPRAREPKVPERAPKP